MTKPPIRAELLELLANQPAFPSDQEYGRWSSEQRRAFIAATDRQIAHEAAMRPTTRLRLDSLTPEQLKRIIACQSPQEYEEVADAILNGKPLPPLPAAATGRKATKQ